MAIAAGIAVGHLFPDFGVSLKVLGDSFIKLVKMIIAPVIFLTVVMGIGWMGRLGKVGGVFGRALAYFLAVSTLALIVGLVVAASYSFNLDGTNIYMTLASLFIAQAVGVELSFADQLLLVLVAMVSFKGAAGLTGAGFVILAAALSVVPSLPVAGMALILGVDRFMSECRALNNLIGNAMATTIVDKWTGALDVQQHRRTPARSDVDDIPVLDPQTIRSTD